MKKIYRFLRYKLYCISQLVWLDKGQCYFIIFFIDSKLLNKGRRRAHDIHAHGFKLCFHLNMLPISI